MKIKNTNLLQFPAIFIPMKTLSRILWHAMDKHEIYIYNIFKIKWKCLEENYLANSSSLTISWGDSLW
jgi:hypothetical protein